MILFGWHLQYFADGSKTRRFHLVCSHSFEALSNRMTYRMNNNLRPTMVIDLRNLPEWGRTLKFSMSHLMFIGDHDIFTSDNPPRWLKHREYKWWYESHVLKLQIGESIDSDFQKITRLE